MAKTGWDAWTTNLTTGGFSHAAIFDINTGAAWTSAPFMDAPESAAVANLMKKPGSGFATGFKIKTKKNFVVRHDDYLVGKESASGAIFLRSDKTIVGGVFDQNKLSMGTAIQLITSTCDKLKASKY